MGCAGAKFATYQGAAPSLPQAQYQVLGQTRYDQVWIDKTIEAEVAGFGMKRPQKRPTSLTAKPVMHKVVSTPAPKLEVIAPTPISLPPPPVKKHWWQRFKG